MGSTGILFPTSPVRRLGDLGLPSGVNIDCINRLFIPLPQIPGFGWAGCTPRHSGRKLQEAVNGQTKWDLMQEIAHVKRWVIEHVTSYIDGELPWLPRQAKYALDAIRILIYIEQVVATANFLLSLIAQEYAFAARNIAEANALLAYGQALLTPQGLQTAAERELAAVWAQAAKDLARQASQNAGDRACLL
ncbi:MAG TPA: hypothetical protein VI756_09105 [Blastocatellia bacterium]